MGRNVAQKFCDDVLMLRPRIIPFLMIHNGGLVKTQSFTNPKYIGDPLNAVKIFNEKQADELIVVDIDATARGREPDFNLIAKLAKECRMPLCYGGGINSAEQALKIIDMGVEKVAVSSAAVDNPKLITQIADAVGSQSVVAVLDVRKKRGFFSKGYEVVTHNAQKIIGQNYLEIACQLQEAGAGELVINSVDRDGSMEGYDLPLVREIHHAIRIPMTVLGGAGSNEHIKKIFLQLGIVGAAAGSLFLFKGKFRAVLINYPTPEQKQEFYDCLK